LTFSIVARDEEAKVKHSQAAEITPNPMELSFWQAVTPADTGMMDRSLPLFQKTFAWNPNWADLVKRLLVAGLMKDDPEVLKKNTITDLMEG